MLKVAAVVFVGIPLALFTSLLAVVFATGLMMVDVREGGPDGHHLIVPVPLLAAQAALAFAPRDKLNVDIGPEAAQHLGVAREVLEALNEAPDGELVRVEEPGENVLVTKEGDALHVRVHDRNDDVDVKVPIGAALEMLPREGHELDVSRAVGALRRLRHTDVVDVKSGDDHVKIWVW